MVKVNKDEAVQWYAQNRGLYKKLAEKVHNIILELLEESNITIHAVTSRAKELDSFKNKIGNPKYDDPINQITDFSGIRIIAYVDNDIKPICDIIKDSFNIDSNNSIDKSQELGTDKVGYKSIHYVAKIKDNRLNLPEYKKFKNLKFEIQIRTILQHAWAEIEHDKNYKFTGVLRPDIQRRFKILAGTLELIDREFNQLSNEIDKISDSVIIAEKKDKLNSIPINSTTLKQYLMGRFKSEIESNILTSDFNNYDDVIIEELQLFGIKNLKDLENIIPPNINQYIKKIFDKNQIGNFLGILRDFMIITNPEKYFEFSWRNKWEAFAPFSLRLYDFYNIDYKNISVKYGVEIQE